MSKIDREMKENIVNNIGRDIERKKYGELKIYYNI